MEYTAKYNTDCRVKTSDMVGRGSTGLVEIFLSSVLVEVGDVGRRCEASSVFRNFLDIFLCLRKGDR